MMVSFANEAPSGPRRLPSLAWACRFARGRFARLSLEVSENSTPGFNFLPAAVCDARRDFGEKA
ncbi:MAG: hypothetical protein ACK4TD_01565 [Ectopseudomonas guguanensis]|uniref:hypothetical protein n=1 Tax=Ectopseudomonas guguanensis TaxID=1198456 RepID=UPI00391CF3DD